MEYWKQELYHHGILGMKWGKRNGPPYPLSRDSSGHTAEERKAGWQKSQLGKRNTSLYDRNEAENARRRYWEKKGRSTPPKKKSVLVRSNGLSGGTKNNKKYAESRRGAKEYKKMYDKYSKEGYLKKGDKLEKAYGDKYYEIVDSIQDEAIRKASKEFADKYGSQPNSKHIPSYMSPNLLDSNKRAGSIGEKSGRKLVSETTAAGRIATIAMISALGGSYAAYISATTGGGSKEMAFSFLASMGLTAAALGTMVAAQEISYKKDKDKNIKNNTKFDEIVKIKGPHSEKSDQKAINPKFNDDFKYQMNCTMCTTAYEMRRRGYDVEANATTKGRMTRDAAAWFNVSDDNIYDFKDYKDFKSKINTMPDGARGNVCAQVGPFLSLHSMAWEKKGNSVIIRDCQTNETYNSLDSSIINQEGNIFEFFRTDNATINEELIMDAIRKAGS